MINNEYYSIKDLLLLKVNMFNNVITFIYIDEDGGYYQDFLSNNIIYDLVELIYVSIEDFINMYGLIYHYSTSDYAIYANSNYKLFNQDVIYKSALGNLSKILLLQVDDLSMTVSENGSLSMLNNKFIVYDYTKNNINLIDGL